MLFLWKVTITSDFCKIILHYQFFDLLNRAPCVYAEYKGTIRLHLLMGAPAIALVIPISRHSHRTIER
jgi:hypothetical protein